MFNNKNRNRDAYSFANINLLGKCNVDCFFCLGKDIDELLSKHDQTATHFSEWKNFDAFLNLCKKSGINKLYITGQNTDSLLYKYLEELIVFLQEQKDFSVGLRTNGYLALNKMQTLNLCKNSVGYSIHTLNPDVNQKIMGTKTLPKWREIIPQTTNPRINVVINRYNVNEFFTLMAYFSRFKNIKYVQVRRVSTDTRTNYLKQDVEAYENLFNYVDSHYRLIGTFYGAQRYRIFNLETVFWRTVETSVNSLNYFTDGTISNCYFIVEGYLKNYAKQQQF
jgi:molybdenum cofactor biosynthesis enzyme MoaA